MHLQNLIDIESRNSLDFIINGIDAVIYVIDVDNATILYANDKCKQEFGDIIGRTCYKVLQTGKSEPCEDCLLSNNNYLSHINSTYKWEHTNSINNKTYLFSERIIPNNTKNGYVKIQIGIDVTNQKELENKILEQQLKTIETFEALSNATIEGLIIYNSKKECIKVNKIAPELLGYTPDEMIGKSAFDFISEESIELVKRVIRNQDQSPYEAIMVRKDGSKFPAMLRGKDIKLGDEKIRVSALMDITNIKLKEAEISQLAYYDSLTSLPNRTLLEDRLTQLIYKTKRTGQYSALMFIDLDHFKIINDTRGHIVGDKILQQCANRLSVITRQYDTVARFGGDEFIVLIDTQTTDYSLAVNDISIIADKILHAVKQPFYIDSNEYLLSASIGIAMFNTPISIDELMKRADSAMYHSKDNGRDKYSFFNQTLQTSLERKATLLSKLREAIEHKKVKIQYQMQVDYNKTVVGVEALARWTDEELGVISPIEFIPIAEESGLIVKFSIYLLHEVATLIKSWENDEIKSKWRVSINISLKQFERDDFYDVIHHLIRKYNIEANKIRLEITESLLLKDAHNALLKINQLKALGVTISIDDFGTGYSSLSYLKKLPIDELKIDKSFVADILDDKNDETIVVSILSIAKQFGFDVIAEGIENEEIYQKLIDLGCSYFQGYCFHKPAPKEYL